MSQKSETYKRHLKTPISYYGGKQRMLKHIVPKIPAHHTYCEPFFGGGAVYFAKQPSQVEIINDVQDQVINFYRVLKNQYKGLCKEIAATLHSRSTLQLANSILNNPKQKNQIKRAWAFWVRCTMSFSSKTDKNASFGYDKYGQVTKKVKNAKEHILTNFGARLENVEIENWDALKVIATRDSPQTFFYLDPPYPNTNQGGYSGYSIEDFEALLKVLKGVKGKFILSSYPEEILDQYRSKQNWFSEDHKKRLLVVQRDKPKYKVECLTTNFDWRREPLFNSISSPINGIEHEKELLEMLKSYNP